MSVPGRIQQFLEGRHLEELPTPDAHVAALWQKALASARDARHSTTSLDNQYVLGYQALLQMGTAVLACAGYRTRGAQGHHATTFFAVAALGIDGLEKIDIRTDRIRKLRKVSAYEPGSPTAEQISGLNALLDELMARCTAACRVIPGIPLKTARVDPHPESPRSRMRAAILSS